MMISLSAYPPGQSSVYFAAKSKTTFNGKLDYQVKNLQMGVQLLKTEIEAERKAQKADRLLGSHKIKEGKHQDLITDDFLALWNIAKDLGATDPLNQDERDAFNIAMFLLMNEDAHETGSSYVPFFKTTTAQQSVQVKLPSSNPSDDANVVLSGLLCPGSFVTGARAISLGRIDIQGVSPKLQKRPVVERKESKALFDHSEWQCV